jgi:hypothetical protein
MTRSPETSTEQDLPLVAAEAIKLRARRPLDCRMREVAAALCIPGASHERATSSSPRLRQVQER